MYPHLSTDNFSDADGDCRAEIASSIHAYYFPLGECRELRSHWPVLSKPGYAIFYICDYTDTLSVSD